MISCCSIQWLLRLLWCGWAGSQKLLRLCSSYEPLCLSYTGRPRPWRLITSRAAKQSSNGPCDQRKRIARGCRYAAAMKIFFAARARAKKFFFSLTRFVERTGDALVLVCLGNPATHDRLLITSPQCGCMSLLKKRFGRPALKGPRFVDRLGMRLVWPACGTQPRLAVCAP